MRIKPGSSTAALLVAVFLFTLPAFTAEATSTSRLIEVNGTATTVPTIEVSGNGEAAASPDIAYLSLQVETHAPTAEASSSQNAAIASKVVDALKSRLAGKGRVSTGGYSLSPEYAREPMTMGRRPRIVGYVARNSIMVETGELNILGALIDSAIAAGANQVNYLNFGLRNDLKARTEAIAKASRDAQAQAQALAASLGVKLRRVIKASIAPIYRPMPQGTFAVAAMGSAQAPTPVEPGQITVNATVSLIYEIE